MINQGSLTYFTLSSCYVVFWPHGSAWAMLHLFYAKVTFYWNDMYFENIIYWSWKQVTCLNDKAFYY